LDRINGIYRIPEGRRLARGSYSFSGLRTRAGGERTRGMGEERMRSRTKNGGRTSKRTMGGGRAKGGLELLADYLFPLEGAALSAPWPWKIKQVRDANGGDGAPPSKVNAFLKRC
jgi:hypothetical protein